MQSIKFDENLIVTWLMRLLSLPVFSSLRSWEFHGKAYITKTMFLLKIWEYCLKLELQTLLATHTPFFVLCLFISVSYKPGYMVGSMFINLFFYCNEKTEGAPGGFVSTTTL